MSISSQFNDEGCSIRLLRRADPRPRQRSKEARSNACTRFFETRATLSVMSNGRSEEFYLQSFAQGIETLFERFIEID